MRRGAVADMAPLQRAFGIVPSGTVPRPPKLCPSWDRLMPGARARRLVLAVQQATPRMRHHRRPITEGPSPKARARRPPRPAAFSLLSRTVSTRREQAHSCACPVDRRRGSDAVFHFD